jgi:hypothetical protein
MCHLDLDWTLRDQSNEHECDFQRPMPEHGEKVGLLFTDATHELLDSPLTVTSDYSAREHFLYHNKEPDNTPIDFQLNFLKF